MTYLKVVLTLIAAALLLIALQGRPATAERQSYYACSGKIRANGFGGDTKFVGGYDVDVSCYEH
jgi:hypothetical protein